MVVISVRPTLPPKKFPACCLLLAAWTDGGLPSEEGGDQMSMNSFAMYNARSTKQPSPQSGPAVNVSSTLFIDSSIIVVKKNIGYPFC